MPSTPKGAFLSDDGGELTQEECFLSLSLSLSLFLCVCVCVCVCVKGKGGVRADRDTPETKNKGVVVHSLAERGDGVCEKENLSM